jgi:hypothetical protein
MTDKDSFLHNLDTAAKEHGLKGQKHDRLYDAQELNVPAFITRIPNFFRWIIIIPVALLAMIIISGVNKIITSSYLGIDPESFLLNVYVSCISSAVFVYVGAIVAPKKQFLISILLSLLVATVAGMSLILNITTQTYPQPAQIIYTAFSLVGVSVTVYAIHEEIIKRRTSK